MGSAEAYHKSKLKCSSASSHKTELTISGFLAPAVHRKRQKPEKVSHYVEELWLLKMIYYLQVSSIVEKLLRNQSTLCSLSSHTAKSWLVCEASSWFTTPIFHCFFLMSSILFVHWAVAFEHSPSRQGAAVWLLSVKHLALRWSLRAKSSMQSFG